MPSGKKPVIELPIRVILTEAGVGFFMDKGRKLSKFTMADGSDQYGVPLGKVTPASLQHMLRIGYLNRLELSRPEFTTVRSDLMDLSKLIVYGFLYKQFDATVFDILVSSSMIKEWNRSNPGSIIDERTKINEGFMRDALQKNADQVKAIRKIIGKPLVDKTIKDTALQADEKNVMVFLVDRFLDNTRPFVWFVLTRFSSYPEHKEIVNEIRELLDLYLRRSRIADFLTLLLMELAISAETINFSAFMERRYGDGADVQSYLFDPAKRTQMLKDMESEKADLSIAWKIGNPHSHSIGTENKLELTIYNREAEFLELKEKVDEKLKTGAGVTVAQFYQTTGAGNSEMGLHYLGYLQDECDKVGLRFNSRVSEIRGEMPSISLTLHF